LNQLATLLSSAIPLKNALHILQDNCTQLGLHQWLSALIELIESGLPFSQSLEIQGKYLNFQEIQLIQVGEMTGKLAEVCTKIAERRTQSLTLQRKLQKIMLYPAMVLGISLSLTLILLLFVVPQFAEMYGENSAELPTLTAVLLAMSQFLQHHFITLMIICIFVIFMLKMALKHSLWLNQKKNALVNRMPIWGNIICLSRLISFSHNLQLMLQSGVALTPALNSFLPKQQTWQTQRTLKGDILLQQEVRSILQWVSQGYPFSESVSSHLFPMEAQQMLQIGEKSGKLALMLRHIADNYQEKLNHQIDLLSQLLEPLMMLIIGSLIGIIMMGMYLPIFNMGSVIQ
jgi:protein transport protein hofC homolog